MPPSNWLLASAEAKLDQTVIRNPGPVPSAAPATALEGLLEQREILKLLQTFVCWEPDRTTIKIGLILL